MLSTYEALIQKQRYSDEITKAMKQSARDDSYFDIFKLEVDWYKAKYGVDEFLTETIKDYSARTMARHKEEEDIDGLESGLENIALLDGVLSTEDKE